MFTSFFSSLFKKKQKQLTTLDTILIKKLKELATQSNLLVFKDVNIYHHKNIYNVGLMVIDNSRGIYLFETKEWTFSELKSATIEKAQKQENSVETLAFENTHSIIRKKFNELTHNDGVPIFNYLLMENLSAEEYAHLHDSFKKLLPQEKIIFSDSLQTDIFKKLHNASEAMPKPFDNNTVVGTLLIQYAILDMYHDMHLATSQQRKFIDLNLQTVTELKGTHGSGKSSVVLLKSIVTLLKNKEEKIIIIKPTLLACDLLKKRLLEIIEHGIVEIDLTSIEIITPLELLNRHHKKLGKDKIYSLQIDEKLLKKSFFIAHVVFCDDAHLLQKDFVEYLKILQKKEKLVLVMHEENIDSNSLNELTKNFRVKEKKITFHKTNPHAKAMHLISMLLKNEASNIVLVSNSLSREKLKDDLKSFINEKAETLQSDVHLINQKFNNLLLCGYEDINAIEAHHIILMDLGFLSKNEIEYAFHLSTKSVDVLYEEESQEITNLRNTNE